MKYRIVYNNIIVADNIDGIEKLYEDYNLVLQSIRMTHFEIEGKVHETVRIDGLDRFIEIMEIQKDYGVMVGGKMLIAKSLQPRQEGRCVSCVSFQPLTGYPRGFGNCVMLGTLTTIDNKEVESDEIMMTFKENQADLLVGQHFSCLHYRRNDHYDQEALRSHRRRLQRRTEGGSR